MHAMEKITKVLKNMFNRAWGLIISSGSTWDTIAEEKAPIARIRKNYIFPWIFLCIILSFAFEILYAESRPIEKGLLNAIITAIALFGGYFISNMICLAYLKKSKPELASKNECETVVAYAFTVIILIEVITIIIPSLFFLRILSVFTAYVVWDACRAIWQMNEEERGNIVLVFSIVLIFVPIIINRIIHLLLPNA